MNWMVAHRVSRGWARAFLALGVWGLLACVPLAWSALPEDPPVEGEPPTGFLEFHSDQTGPCIPDDEATLQGSPSATAPSPAAESWALSSAASDSSFSWP